MFTLSRISATVTWRSYQTLGRRRWFLLGKLLPCRGLGFFAAVFFSVSFFFVAA
jgi:hypothetical protein